MGKTILVVHVHGYDRNHVPSMIEDKFSEHQSGNEWYHGSYGYHKYYWNSEGCQLLMITNHSIPDGTGQYEVFDKVWGIEDELQGPLDTPDHAWWVDQPREFFVDGQRYLYLGNVHGYHSDSVNPDDERYEA